MAMMIHSQISKPQGELILDIPANAIGANVRL
jgi:hypothetical protein